MGLRTKTRRIYFRAYQDGMKDALAVIKRPRLRWFLLGVLFGCILDWLAVWVPSVIIAWRNY